VASCPGLRISSLPARPVALQGAYSEMFGYLFLTELVIFIILALPLNTLGTGKLSFAS